jgi:oligoribonuclease
MKKLLWLDMEMTGLDVSKERIIEVAVIVTDLEFKTLETYESIVFQNPQFINNMDEWNINQHTKSGLIEKIPNGLKQEKVEEALCQFVEKHFNEEKAILCGNSISQDKKFIDAYMPKLSQKLHYRLLDVTAWKIIMNSRYGVEYEKKDNHRALDDIKESIEELKTFLKFIEAK